MTLYEMDEKINHDSEIIKNNKCEKCMFDAPYKWCCKRECGEHMFCKDCNAKSKGYRSDSESC